jgi:hypothetical protein
VKSKKGERESDVMSVSPALAGGSSEMVNSRVQNTKLGGKKS